MAAAFVHLATTSTVAGCYNIGSGEPVRIADVVSACVEEFPGSSSPIQFGAVLAQPDDPGMLVACIDKLRATGWQPAIGLQRGLRAYARHVRETSD